MKKSALILTAVVILFSLLLAGCGGGIAPEQYEGVVDQLTKAKELVSELQDENQNLQAEKEGLAVELKTTQAEVTELESQVSELQEQYELLGATKAETAENIVRNYYKTHEYSTTDLFVCSDMASEVWNMLKAHGINARIVVGNKDTAIGDILQSNHAWVLAEVAPGEYLALETTAGRVVQKSENALYYRGWYFNSPAQLETHNNLVREYNVRVGIRNKIVDEANEVRDEHNKATDPNTADKLEAVYNKLIELIEEQEEEMNDIKAELDSLASRCGT